MSVTPEPLQPESSVSERPTSKPLHLFRLRTSLEVHQSSLAFSRLSGLTPDQYVVSRWGFPTMPKPEPRKASGRVRLGPANLRDDFIGHPLFWIDPTLTSMKPSETRQDWCVRMYYLLCRLGLWRQNSWVDFPRSRGVELSVADLEGYRMRQNPAIATDGRANCAFLTDTDLHGGVEAHRSDVKGALTKIVLLRQAIESEIANRQQLALRTVEELVGPDDVATDVHRVSPESVGKHWSRAIKPRLNQLVLSYGAAIAPGQFRSSGISELVDLALEISDQIQRDLNRLRTSTYQLALPVLQRMADSETSAAVPDAYLEYLDRRRRCVDEVAQIFTAALDRRSEEALLDAEREVLELYARARSALRHAYVNFRLAELGLPIFLTDSSLTNDLNTRAAGDSSVTAKLWPLHPDDFLETFGDPAINPRRRVRQPDFWPEIVEDSGERF